MLKQLFLTVLLLAIAVPTWATTYHTNFSTGNDTTGDGSSGTPWKTLQKCADVATSGDICLGTGTYTDTDSDGNVVETVSSGVTYRAATPLGATISLSGLNAANSGFAVLDSTTTIEGFIITGGTSNGTSAAHAGVNLISGSGTIIQDNTFVDVARTVCSASAFGNAGVFSANNSSYTIRRNIFHSIGRLRNGESGCTDTVVNDQHDHGIYLQSGNGVVVENNIVYNIHGGFSLVVFGATLTNLTIRHNTFVGEEGDASPNATVGLFSTINTADIVNNIIYLQSGTQPHGIGLSGTYSSVSIRKNISNLDVTLHTATGVTIANNINDATIDFTDDTGRDYTLLSTSDAIDVGETISAVSADIIGTSRPQGSAYDMGAYEFLVSGGGGEGGQHQNPTNDSPRRNPLQFFMRYEDEYVH
jgi:hypothetical protein